MKYREFLIIGTVVLMSITVSAVPIKDAYGQLSKDWHAAGSHPKDYDMGGNPTVKHGSEGGGYIKSKASYTKGFGTWMTNIEVDKYLGKRLRMSGYVKTEKVEGLAVLWMRVDGVDTMLSFDNMGNRPIKGTTDWKKYEVVLDVPENSTGIFYGILLDGKGQAWVDGLQLETVSNEVPVTDVNIKFNYFKQGKYKEAAVLFQKEVKEGNTEDIYNHLFIFLSHYGAGQIEEAQKHILEFSNTLKDDKWITPVAHFYAGKITENALLKAAENEDEKKDKEQKCEAYYYIGMMYLLKEDLTKAKDYLEKCVATDVKSFIEYDMAKTELERIHK
jgi:tetratricopeptide (TPR) repeat protein